MRYSADQDKWHFLRDVPQTDRWHPLIKRLARDLLDAAQSDQRKFAYLAHTVARDWIRQESDTDRTGGEDIAGLTRKPSVDDAVDALLRGTDDCDAKARLFVALCLAAGLNASIVPYWKRVDGTTHHNDFGFDGEQLYHVAARVFVNGRWLPVELTLARARLGEPGELVPTEAGTKHWLKAVG